MHFGQARLPKGRGFTLIELLVVVAIIALLISILLPALGGAREQTKAVRCLANLKDIGHAMQMYFVEHNDWFPTARSNHHPLTGTYYGGHPGRPPGWGYTNLTARDTPAGRPFNRYLYPQLPNYDIPDQNDPQFEMVRQLPLYFCPSDDGGVSPDQPGEPDGRWPLHYEWGTSYVSNHDFIWSWAIGYRGGMEARNWNQLANAYLKVQLQRYAPLFLILMEDPFGSSQWLHIPRRGWHKKLNRHNFLFLDAHAAAVTTDTVTKSATSGPGWKTGSGNSASDPYAWWNNEFDPDYLYRLLPPLPGN